MAVPATPIILIEKPAKPQLSREAKAHSSRLAKDFRGPLPSLYRGKYFSADQERFRLCVGWREGKFEYRVRGGGNLIGDHRGDYYGPYQFSYEFQKGESGRWGVPGMMASESRKTHDGLFKQAWKLLHKPINKWSRYWQDRAFYTVLNFNGKWRGKHHWGNGAYSC